MGTVRVEGEPLPPGDPAAAFAAGIATIYQELDLVADLTVAENLFLGHELRRGVVDRPAAVGRHVAPSCSNGWGTRRSTPVLSSAASAPPSSRSSRSPGRSPARRAC